MLTESQYKAWLSALRSGKYTQIKYKLHTSGNCFCVLGVLADILMKDRPTFSWRECSDYGYSLLRDNKTDTEYSCTLHYDLIGDVNRGFLSKLSHWNDNGYDFKKLTNIIQLNKHKLVATSPESGMT